MVRQGFETDPATVAGNGRRAWPTPPGSVEADLRRAQEMAGVGSWTYHSASRAVVWSRELCRLFGVDEDDAPIDLAGHLALVHPDDRAGVEAVLESAAESDEVFEVPHRVLAGGELRWVRYRGHAVRGADGRAVGLFGVCQDVTDQKRAEDGLTRQALHDPLTGLANRTLFLDRLDHALRGLDRSGAGVAVLYVDLDRFKQVNDNHPLRHAAGDTLLREVARRLERILRPRDSVARLGGDEFAILCDDLATEGEAVAVASRIIETVAVPFDLHGRPGLVGASVGIAFTTDADAVAEALLRDADSAMYRAKERGRGRYDVFDHETRLRIAARVARAEELRQALDRAELRVYFQPDVDLRRETSVGVEALVRWQHPVLGLVAPVEFIDVAEESGLIVPLGEWVLGEACRRVAGWPAGPGQAPPTVSVNLSARQLTQRSLVEAVDAAVRDSGLQPHRLCLEITESVLMEDVESSVRVLLALKALGVRIAIDDFGTGYSSLSYLRRFPVDVVKIDRSFVAGLGVDPAADAIVAAVVNLSHALGLRVVAEGVETEEQLLAVRALGCDRAQGFYWSRPVPIDDARRWSEGARPTGSATEPVDLRALLVERTEALRAATARPVVLQTPPKLGSAVAELRAVRSVLDHLLGNAVTFSPEGRPVVVSAAADRRWVRISVTDFGIGMTEAESSRCFEQFWQAADRSVTGTPGTGIGLYVVRSLVDAMGGHVGVRSVKGKGSTFTIALPRSARAAGQRPPAGTHAPGVSEGSTIREFMRQIGVPTRRGT
ncbi:MAG TPA: EAL domain-containing protein [Acidimicrobiales bacterium]|nr:EAL domain-containing protein [Acidimicrobiales bacterium]